jgi:predicted nucleic acid-binding protein
MILVDTSAWIEYFRATKSSAAIEVGRLLADQTGQIVMCEPIAMEILCGATNETYPMLERLVNGLPSLPVDNAVDFRTAADIYRSARRAGKTIRSVNDCLIVAVAIRHGARFVHCDTDFDVIAQIANLEAASFR